MVILGMDIGGSHASVARIAWRGGEADFSGLYEADVDAFLPAEVIVAAWATLIREAADGDPDIRLGIAMPGPFDYPNGISLIKDQGKMRALYGLSVKNLLAESLGIAPDCIAFTNDAEAFLLGESLAGSGCGFENSIGLTLGTGLGSAFKIGEEVKDAKLWTAPFRDGVAEDYLGTGWIRRYVSEQFGVEVAGLKQLFDEADSEVSELVLEEFGRTLGEFLEPYIASKQYAGLVLGGKISRAADRFLSHTLSYLEKHGQSLEVRISALGERAAMLGACVPFLNR